MSTKKPTTRPKAKKAAKAKPRTKAGTSKVSAADRKKLFVEAYITNGGNATAAAVTAGFAVRSAHNAGARLVKDSEVSAEIGKRAKEVANKYELTTELAARSIYQELTFDPVKLYDENGQLKDITELDEDTRMALAGVEFEQIGSPDAPIHVRKVKWAPRHQAREQLMKHLGMFGEDNKQKLTVSIINLGGRG